MKLSPLPETHLLDHGPDNRGVARVGLSVQHPMSRLAAAFNFVIPSPTCLLQVKGGMAKIGCPIQALSLGLSGIRSTRRPTLSLVIPTGANQDFLLRGTSQRPHVRLSVRKAA